MAFPVTIVSSGGFPVVHVAGVDGATPLTPVDAPLYGFAITLVSSDGLPANLVNDDLTAWSSGGDALLIETGDRLLLESGDGLLLE